MDERRFADRYQEIAARRQIEMEHTRREQEMARRMQEVRDREVRLVLHFEMYTRCVPIRVVSSFQRVSGSNCIEACTNTL